MTISFMVIREVWADSAWILHGQYTDTCSEGFLWLIVYSWETFPFVVNTQLLAEGFLEVFETAVKINVLGQCRERGQRASKTRERALVTNDNAAGAKKGLLRVASYRWEMMEDTGRVVLDCRVLVSSRSSRWWAMKYPCTLFWEVLNQLSQNIVCISVKENSTLKCQSHPAETVHDKDMYFVNKTKQSIISENWTSHSIT